MIKAVLFDIDGTLVDSNDLHVAAWMQVFEDAALKADEQDVRAQIGKGGDNLLPSLFPSITEQETRELSTAHGSLFKRNFIERVEAFQGAAALLRRVDADGRRVVLATSAGREELDHYVDLLGIADVIVATTTKDDVETSKPAPDIFSAALEKVGVAAEQAIVVGDTPYDVEAAGRAGMGSIGVLSGGFSSADLCGADMIYHNVADLLEAYETSPLNC